MSLLTLVAVQLADVSIATPLKADVLIVIGAMQVAVAFWCLQLRRCRLEWKANVLAFFGLEAALFLMLIVSVPWDMVAGNSIASRPKNPKARMRQVDLTTTSPHDFSGFRGKERTGKVVGTKLERGWDRRAPRQLWRRLIGAGWSSFAVVGDYCVTHEQRGAFEAVVCYELRTGRQCWVHLDRAYFRQFAGEHGPRATPTVDQGRVYALGATGILNCLNGSTGRPIWSVNILDDNQAKNCFYGMAGSSLVVEPYVIVAPGGPGTSLVAYDSQTGRRVWRGGDGQGSYSSPQLAVLCGERQVVIFNGDGLYGHNLDSGEVRWGYDWVSNPDERNNVCQPIIFPSGRPEDPGRVFISSGYGKGCALLEVRRTADRFSVREQWSNRNLKAKFTSVVIRGQYVYGLDERILTCIDLKTGKRSWKRGRYGFGQLILVDDLLLIQAETGDVALVEANPSRFHELGRFAALDGRTWNHPVLAGPLLLVRNDHEAACYELPLAKK